MLYFLGSLHISYDVGGLTKFPAQTSFPVYYALEIFDCVTSSLANQATNENRTLVRRLVDSTRFIIYP